MSQLSHAIRRQLAIAVPLLSSEFTAEVFSGATMSRVSRLNRLHSDRKQPGIVSTAGGTVELIRDGKVTRRTSIPAATHSWSIEETSDGQHHWIRMDVRDAGGKLALLGNFIYVN